MGISLCRAGNKWTILPLTRLLALPGCHVSRAASMMSIDQYHLLREGEPMRLLDVLAYPP